MDDQTFDERTALDWIKSVEDGGGARDSDIYPALREWLDRTSPLKILEIGCGQGICSDNIDIDGRTYTGIEPSTFLVNRARELYQQANRKFLPGNAYNLPFSDETFDAAFSVLVWHLLGNLRTATHELSRVLKAGGYFLIITANPSAYPAWKDFYTNTRSEGSRFEGTMQLSDGIESRDVLYLHTFDGITGALRHAGLETQHTTTFRTSEKSKGQEYLLAIQGQKRSP